MLKPKAAVSLLGAVIAVWPVPLSALPGPGSPPPPPPLPGGSSEEAPSRPTLRPTLRREPALAGPSLTGQRLSLNGLSQRAAWLWMGASDQPPRQLWLPLEVLQGQLGVSGRPRVDGVLELEWFGQRLVVPAAQQRSLGDEVAVDVAPLLAPTGLAAAVAGDELRLRVPPPQLRQARASTAPAGLRRVVLDLSGPALVRGGEGGIWIGAEAAGSLASELRRLGLTGRREGSGWTLAAGGAPRRVFTLGQPARVVIDWPTTPPGAGEAAATTTTPARAPLDPRLRALLGSDVLWSKEVRSFAGQRLRLNSVRMDPLSSSLELRSLSRGAAMEGLSTLPQLAQRYDALVAINGGYFNRVRRLPLGALRDQGRWLSGPILNRGVVAWDPGALPRFGRLSLREWLSDAGGRPWPVEFVNSGFVRRGLARFNADWGPRYRALSGGERAVVLREGVVRRRYDSAWLAAGVPLSPGEELLVARAGSPLPWGEGERLTLSSEASTPLGQAANVMGGGPLLLQDGRVVLDGQAEGFSAAFLQQGAPRTVIGSDGRFLWLVTVEGLGEGGPTLAETARLLQAVGLRDALNLDGGSSTGLVMGGLHLVKGRGVVSGVHNGLGLVPKAADPEAPAPTGPAPVQGL